MTADVADVAALVALAGLKKVGPARARWLLTGGTATEVVGHLRADRLPAVSGPAPAGVTAQLVATWGEQLRAVDLHRCVEPYERAGIQILHPGHRLWPYPEDPDPPAVLFAQGRPELAAGAGPWVAVIGTRRCTAIGRRVARDLGAALAAAGVAVVSGLATGIDGAAHQGALDVGGPVIGVVGTGLDVVYPRANGDLWREVAGRGLLLSEAVLGTSGDRWRFPARNRLIAGLADAVVVVESHLRGGSLHTVDEAIARGVPVMAVPGAVTNPASAGTNRLLVDGAAPVCSADEVLDLLGLAGRLPSAPPAAIAAVSGSAAGAVSRSPAGAGAGDDPVATAILVELAAGSAHIDHLVAATGKPLTAVLAAVGRLDRGGLATVLGSTVERVESHGSPPGVSYPHGP